MRTPPLLGVLTAALLAILLAAPSTAAAAPPPTTDGDARPLIVGGRNATQSYPFMGSLQSRSWSGHMCGASLIAPTWAVTAAHCLHEGTDKRRVLDPARWQVRVNSLDSGQGGEVLPAAQFILHPEYVRTVRLIHDIALIRLARPAATPPIPIADAAGPVGTRTRIMGWGTTCPDPNRQGPNCFPETLQELDTTILDPSRCEVLNRGSEICTDSPGGNSGVCYGDSGGPQVRTVAGRWELIGVASHLGSSRTSTCGRYPSGYVDVPAHRDWIQQHTGRR
ncbi:Trypsin [Amycolatopsis arida]|uniref:Trypsin n=1 Tax=Amycolatopsis arida TaxID=587909 RepID=A0A1I6AWX0_9PSEU|nr:serine protease [Amycolatopsis arida]TDX85377.1 trypsin [Amycolatopsis arida]SFQ73109.1 Trypsin [Amycolatopsis arida]